MVPTAPGPYGIPYSAWSANLVLSVWMLLVVHDLSASGFHMSVALSSSLLVCLAKPVAQVTDEGPAPTVSETRPQALRNTDANTIGKTTTMCMQPLARQLCVNSPSPKEYNPRPNNSHLLIRIVGVDGHMPPLARQFEDGI